MFRWPFIWWHVAIWICAKCTNFNFACCTCANEVKAYLIESGYNVENFVEGKKKASAGEGDKKRSNGFANVEFSSVEEAMSAVGKLHSTRPSSVKGLSRRGLVFSFTSRNSC